jgi:hypothetical protein
MENAAPAPLPAAAKVRRWPMALLVGVITAILSACAITPIADWITTMHHVSNMEGGRGCLIIIVWIPLGALLGIVVGFITTLLVRQSGFLGYVIPQAIAIGVCMIVLGAVAGIGYASADHPPLIEGKELALDIQVQTPANGRSIEQLKAADFSVALTVSASDRAYADLRWSDAVESEGKIIVPAWARLNSRNAGREITVGAQGEDRQIFTVMLTASPKKTTDEWSAWETPRETFSGKKTEPNEQYRVRYRVRFAEEYSPTPPPSSPVESSAEESEPTASPDESPSPTPEP